MPSRRVIILAGPTASGKSALAIRVAQAVDGVIINADSMQVYRGIPILSAAPSAEDMAAAPHRLYGYLDPATPCSAGQWVASARIAVYETWQEGKTPVVVGGTGMYIKTLLEGISPIPDIAPATRARIRALPVEAAYARLQQVDAAMAATLNAGDTQRVLRALEVIEDSGKSLLHWQSIPPELPLPDADFAVYTLTLDRALLYARCDQRLEQMVAQGALEELRALLARHLPDDLPALRAVGIPELARHLRGEWTLEQAVEKAQQATRNYAKRQLTWLRHQLPQATAISYPYKDLPADLLSPCG